MRMSPCVVACTTLSTGPLERQMKPQSAIAHVWTPWSTQCHKRDLKSRPRTEQTFTEPSNRKPTCLVSMVGSAEGHSIVSSLFFLTTPYCSLANGSTSLPQPALWLAGTHPGSLTCIVNGNNKRTFIFSLFKTNVWSWSRRIVWMWGVGILWSSPRSLTDLHSEI